jgi:DNA-binding transcriptional regulator YhcF (GntR family)
MRFHPNHDTEIPKYKQVLSQIEKMILDGTLKKGAHLPSMTEIANETGMSKETVKRALVNLRDRGYIASSPGKGYFVSKTADEIPHKINILMILSSMDLIKQMLVDSFNNTLKNKAEVKIILLNSDVEQLECYVEKYCDLYDYYVVMPHFDIDDQTQMRVAKILSRIPNRKFIMIDYCNRFMSGQFGAIYQDLFIDPEKGLSEAVEDLKKARRLNLVTLQSRYGVWTKSSIERFCEKNEISLRLLDSFPQKIEKGEVFFLQTGKLSNALAEFDEIVKNNNMELGKDVGLISYNDVPLNAVVLGGLTTISTDFVKMGRLAADMILCGKMDKIHNEFRMIRRKTF